MVSTTDAKTGEKLEVYYTRIDTFHSYIRSNKMQFNFIGFNFFFNFSVIFIQIESNR